MEDGIQYLSSDRRVVHEAALERWRAGQISSDELVAIEKTCIVPSLPGWTVDLAGGNVGHQILDMAGGLLMEAPAGMRWVAIVAVRLLPKGEP